MPGVVVEACVASAADAVRAEKAGANRIELNRALERDGLTPVASEVEVALASLTLPLVVMVRPHDNGFVYSDSEVGRMAEEVAAFIDLGVQGVVIGPLTEQRRIDIITTKQLVEAAAGREVVFHRAFDTVEDPLEAIDALVDLGITRVLTSGQAPTAVEGIATLRELMVRADGRIEILPGAGVSPHNASELVRSIGCTQLHGSFRNAEGSFNPDLLRMTRRVVDEWA